MDQINKGLLNVGSAGLSERAGRAGASPINVMMARVLADPDLISLAPGFVDYETLPVEEVREAAGALLADESTARAALQYGTTTGVTELREMLANRVAAMDDRTGDYEADDVIVGTGSQQILYLLIEVLTDPGDIVILGHPSYFVFMDALRAGGVSCRAVPLDENGLRTDLLSELVEELDATGALARVKLIYTVSYFQNPTGISLSAARRRRLYEIVQRFCPSAHIVEDAAYRELRYDGDDVASIRSYDEAGETVIYLGTFSKSFSPGLKTGYGLLPKAIARPLANLKGAHDFGSSNFTQHLCCEIMKRGFADTHAEVLRQSYRKRRDLMRTALDEAMPGEVKRTDPHGGLYFWLTLPERVETGPDSKLFKTALEKAMLYVPGEFCFAPGSGLEIPTNCIRLSFGVGKPEKITEGVHRLAEALRTCL